MTRPLRIAQLVSSYSPLVGGVQTHAQRLAEGLAARGDQVTVLTYQTNNHPREEWVGSVRVLRFPMLVNSANYPLSVRLSRYLRSHRAEFDLIHAHSYHTLVGHAAVGIRLPFVFTPHYHGTGHTAFRAFLHNLYRYAGIRLFKAVDAVICVSDAERELLTAHFPFIADKARTIPNGTDYGPPATAASMTRRNEPVVLTVGRLERYKNVDLVIDAFRGLHSEATLVVVGDGPDRSRLERHAQISEPGWPVRFTGKIPDRALDEWLSRANVITSASDHEAFGLTLVNGLACGARAVASDIPAHVELAHRFHPDSPVTIVDPRDKRRFTEALASALAAGHVSTAKLNLPTWDDMVEETRDLYVRLREDVTMRNRDRRSASLHQPLA